jgi:hypothetical protein
VAAEAVAIVPKTSGKIPRIEVRPVQPIKLADGEWQKLEASLGKPLPQQARESITMVTNWFLESAEAESHVGSMEDALKRVERLRTRAQSFHAAIEERPVDDPTRDYVDEILAEAYAHLNSDHTEHEYVVELSVDLSRFLNACDLTLQQLEQDAQRNYWPKGGAWEHWIRQLTDILEEHHLPTGARKDKSKDKSGRASPFVSFVFEFQTLLPKKYIRSQHSKSALAVSIHNARRRSKPAVAWKASRSVVGS